MLSIDASAIFFSIGLYSLLGTNQEKFTKLFHNACVKLRVELQTDSPRLLRVCIDVEKMSQMSIGMFGRCAIGRAKKYSQN